MPWHNRRVTSPPESVSAESIKPKPSDPSIRRTILLLGIVSMSSSMSMRIADPMLPNLAKSFGGVATDMAGVATYFSLAYASLILIQGPLGDRMGKLNIIMWSCVVAALASLACAVAPDLSTLNTLRFVNGAACAGLIPLSLAWIGDNIPIERRQQTLASFASASIAGLVLGQASGGIFADTIGWRWAFVPPAVAYLVGAASLLLLGRQARQARPTTSAAPGFADTITQTLANYRLLFSNPWARTVMICVFFEGALYFGAVAFIPTYLHEAKGIDLWQAGLIVALLGVGGLSFSVASRHLVSHLGLIGGARLGGGLCAGALLTIIAGVTLDGLIGWFLIGLGCIAIGFGFTMLHNTLQTHGTQMLPEARGTAIAGFVMGLFGGQALGIALVALIIPVAGYGLSIGSLGVGIALLGLVYAAKLRARTN